MTNWETYVKESYGIIKRAEDELTITLQHEVEAYLVHLFAYYLDKPKVNTEPLGVKLLESVHQPIPLRKETLKAVGDECLLINAMEWGKRKWPSDNYYADLGVSAYMARAYVIKPPESIFDDLAYEFQTATRILKRCRIN